MRNLVVVLAFCLPWVFTLGGNAMERRSGLRASRGSPGSKPAEAPGTATAGADKDSAKYNAWLATGAERKEFPVEPHHIKFGPPPDVYLRIQIGGHELIPVVRHVVLTRARNDHYRVTIQLTDRLGP